jgi:tRNA modification GTPase
MVQIIHISAKYGTKIESLEQMLYQAADIPEITENNVIVTNLRHYEALTRSKASIQRVIDGLENNLSGDLLSEDLRDCIHTLAEIVGGEITSNEILGNVFKNFCIGK